MHIDVLHMSYVAYPHQPRYNVNGTVTQKNHMCSFHKRISVEKDFEPVQSKRQRKPTKLKKINRASRHILAIQHKSWEKEPKKWGIHKTGTQPQHVLKTQEEKHTATFQTFESNAKNISNMKHTEAPYMNIQRGEEKFRTFEQNLCS